MGPNPHMSRLTEWVDLWHIKELALGFLKVVNQIMILSSSEVGWSVLNGLEAMLKLKSILPDSHS